MKRLVPLAGLLSMACWAVPPLCQGNEATLVACTTRGGNIAICADFSVGVLRLREQKACGAASSPSADAGSMRFMLSRMSGAGWSERHLRFTVGRLSYVVYERRRSGSDLDVALAVFTEGYMPSDGEKAEFKSQFRVEESRCSAFAEIEPGSWPSNLEQEEFVYGP